ncbi:MAG: RagB/SusD family nutrient uptake outer membrane protein [Rhodothermaceae bacterium]|nr:RagB/SusD family nutrient uptake outer membrane protein [Rhodothermaceae bacterium]MYE63915.1 RagB/SusD family nutrient uptake outer membrane protein [Rhodothermaceae bacterium]MYJ19951.1 RagB/SusD family nutrient uptake outer membrane protein [Rhodothermaceae bacterium]
MNFKHIKQMKQFIFYTLVGVLALSAVGCQDLAVENKNSPDRAVAFAQPGDVVNLISGVWTDYWSAVQWCGGGGAFFYSTLADENSSSWANWGMRDMSSEPRIGWDNSATYSRRGSTEGPWFRHYRGISNANDALQAITRAEEEESADNNAFTRDGHDTAQLRAFAKMNQGLMHGMLSLIFDQAFVFDETVDLENDVLELRPYAEVNQEAIRMLEEARAIASANSFSIPWIWGLELSSQDMVKLINSFIARFTVQVARDEAARAAVNWGNVIGLIDAGITEDFVPVGADDGSQQFDCLKFYGQNGTTWSRADYRTIGPADESGGYDDWLAKMNSGDYRSVRVFNIVTADRRIVGSADDPTVDGTDFQYQGNNGPFPAARGYYHYSSHNHKRYQYYLLADANGPMPHMILTEMHMYKAEGLLRTGGSTDEVAELLNITRVSRGQLNPAMGSDAAGSSTDAQSHLDSASLWAKLKHERRIETFQTAGGLAYFDDRGMGDLVTGTPVHFPVPGRELETLGLQNYTFGGVGGVGGAPIAGRFETDNSRPR